MLNDATDEAQRQIEICNACRYCEGYCAVFPAVFDQRSFAPADITQFANLCHNCRGCYYACQYTEPHEFALNLPAALAEVRQENWQNYAWPSGFARLFHRSGMAVALLLVVAIAVMFWISGNAPAGSDFYAVISHGVMVAIFAPAFLLPLLSVFNGIRQYWRDVGGERVRWRHLHTAFADAAQMRNLDGGQGQGCNFEDQDRFTNARRHAHQAVMWGFVLCFAATSAGTVLHYLFDAPAPYGFWSAPKLFGVAGGVLMVIGSVALMALKCRADRALGAASVWGGEMAFVALLGAVAATGLVLYGLTGTTMVPVALAVHLGTVLTLFLITPYSKMVHGAYRMAALVRDAQRRDA